MHPAIPSAPFVPCFPETRANLSHYYVMMIGGNQVAIGEAEHVRQIGSDTWESHVVKWGVNPATKQIDSNIVTDVLWMTVKGPTFILVPKRSFQS